MKQKPLFFLIAVLLLCSSCRTSRSMLKEILPMRSNLFYELTSPEYQGEINHSVYLTFIDYSNLDYYTSVKKSGGLIIPFILVNHEGNYFNVRLGEGSLTQTYREFLTDALLAECNSSTCFNLKDSGKAAIPDSAYRLEVKIIHNETLSKVRLNATNFIWFGPSYIDLVNNRALSALTNLSIAVRLSHGDDCLLDKTYDISHKQKGPHRGFEDSVRANEACLQTMTESLSLATKEIVEDISQELHLTVLIQ